MATTVRLVLHTAAARGECAFLGGGLADVFVSGAADVRDCVLAVLLGCGQAEPRSADEHPHRRRASALRVQVGSRGSSAARVAVRLAIARAHWHIRKIAGYGSRLALARNALAAPIVGVVAVLVGSAGLGRRARGRTRSPSARAAAARSPAARRSAARSTAARRSAAARSTAARRSAAHTARRRSPRAVSARRAAAPEGQQACNRHHPYPSHARSLADCKAEPKASRAFEWHGLCIRSRGRSFNASRSRTDLGGSGGLGGTGLGGATRCTAASSGGRTERPAFTAGRGLSAGDRNGRRHTARTRTLAKYDCRAAKSRTSPV